MKRDEERRKFIEMQRQDAIEYQQAPCLRPPQGSEPVE